MNDSSDNESSANTMSQYQDDDQKGEMRWDFSFGGDDTSPRSSLPPKKPDRSSMYTMATYATLSSSRSSTPPSTPPSSFGKKKHGTYCRIKTVVKKFLCVGKEKGGEVKEDPRILTIKAHQDLLLREEDHLIKYQDIRRARVLLGLQMQMQAGRIRGNVGDMVVKQLSGGGYVLGSEEFAAYMHRAVLQGEISAARASMILGVACDGGF